MANREVIEDLTLAFLVDMITNTQEISATYKIIAIEMLECVV